MMDGRYKDTFRGLPLSPEQDREVVHYIRTRERAGLPWDTPELAVMLGEMLDPPERPDEDAGVLADCLATERQVAENEESDRIDLLRSERDRNH